MGGDGKDDIIFFKYLKGCLEFVPGCFNSSTCKSSQVFFSLIVFTPLPLI